MGLTKQYLRYGPAGNFNIIASQNCNLKFVSLEGQEGRFVAVGACEHVVIWDQRLGEKAQVLSGETSPVTAVCANPNKRHLAAGYADGTVQIYDLRSAEIVSTFLGHKSQITTLAFDKLGHKLASGSKDNDIVVWDIVAESGICRFSGHSAPITQVAFMSTFPVLISASKDKSVKFWDLDTQHNFKTLMGHGSEVWGLVLMKDDQYLVTGCADSDLRVWKLSRRDTDNKNPLEHLASTLELIDLEDADDPTHPLQCHKVGSLLRLGKGRVVSLVSDLTGDIVGCHGTDMQLELFQFCSDDQAQLRLKKRLKKAEKKKKEKLMETDEVKEPSTEQPENMELSLRDEVIRLTPIKLSNKPKSLDLVLGNGGELRVSVSLANNSVQLYSIQTSDKHLKPNILRSISNQGHQSDVRAVAFSSDNLAIASGSGESVKFWNRASQACLRTTETGYVLCLIFGPGDRYVLAGLKSGTLLIIDISVGDVIEEIPAHTAELWSICHTPNQSECVTGGGDQTVKFWQYTLVQDENSESKAKVLSLIHKRTLKVDNDVSCVRVSPNGKFLAVALMDTTVKIFFVDTFKFYLSLYGHSMPILCMDISADSKLIATGSADRNVKIWGMDFGDCHRSLFAHEDSVTGLQFVAKTHYFFTCGKDGRVKEWDGDKFNKILTLQGHAGEAKALAVSPDGEHVITSGNDHVLRLYRRTEETLVLQDEQEEEREKLEALATGEQIAVPGKTGTNLPSNKTIGSEKAVENILECLDVCRQFREEDMKEPVPIMQALGVKTPDDYLLETFKRIRSSDLETALLLLPFSSVLEILEALHDLIDRGVHVELLCNILVLLVQYNHGPIVANQSLLPTLLKLQKVAFEKVEQIRDTIGENLATMRYLQYKMEEDEGVQLFRDATVERKKGEKKRKRNAVKRSLIMLT